MTDLSNIGREFGLSHLEESDLKANPVEQFEAWINEAIQSNIKDPNAMALSTVDKSGRVTSRMILLKYFDESGFAFYTNYQSQKATALSEHPQAALLGWWPDFERQVRIEGSIQKCPPEVSDLYFSQREKEAQIAALISKQSKLLPDKQKFLDDFEEKSKSLKDAVIQRPDYWGGFLLKPTYFEFWQGCPHRVHDRLTYTLSNNQWDIQRLYP